MRPSSERPSVRPSSVRPSAHLSEQRRNVLMRDAIRGHQRPSAHLSEQRRNVQKARTHRGLVEGRIRFEGSGARPEGLKRPDRPKVTVGVEPSRAVHSAPKVLVAVER